MLELIIECALCTSAVQYIHSEHAAYRLVIYKPTGTIYNGDFSTDGKINALYYRHLINASSLSL